jgi:thymidylate kinase
MLSTICYGSKTKEDRGFYIRAHDIILGEDYIKPQITFILSAPPEICLKRLVEAGKILDRFENLEKLSIIHTQYKEIFEEEKNKGYIFLVDSSGSIEETKGSIISIFQKQCLPHKFFTSPVVS